MKYSAFAIVSIAALYNALTALAASLSTDPFSITDTLQGILNSIKGNGSLYSYPTDLTRNLVPKNLHSHNDYWRDVPFYSALSVGAISIEADVWLYNGTLYVGHEESALTKTRTFDSLYIQPILRELNRMNPTSSFVTSQTSNPNGLRLDISGLFDTDSSQTLYLWVDLKTSGPETFRAMSSSLQPLRAASYLTTYDGHSVKSAPVTVIGTGNTPLDMVQGVSPRDCFYDARLDLLNSTLSNITSIVSPIASVDFKSVFSGNVLRTGRFDASQNGTLYAQIQRARSKGIGARYWDTPEFPVGARQRIWSKLWEAGAELINVDDLVAGAGFSDYSNYWEA